MPISPPGQTLQTRCRLGDRTSSALSDVSSTTSATWYQLASAVRRLVHNVRNLVPTRIGRPACRPQRPQLGTNSHQSSGVSATTSATWYQLASAVRRVGHNVRNLVPTRISRPTCRPQRPQLGTNSHQPSGVSASTSATWYQVASAVRRVGHNVRNSAPTRAVRRVSDVATPVHVVPTSAAGTDAAFGATLPHRTSAAWAIRT
jgi:hypothetical protein